VSAKRTQLAQEAKDAEFESLLEYLMFLEVYETCLTSGSSGRCSLVNMFEHRKKNNRIIHNYQHCPLKKLGGLFFAQKQNFSAYCKKAVRLHRRKRELKKAARPCQL